MWRPDLFDLFEDLGYDLVIPSHVEREELIGVEVRAMIRGLLDRGTVRIAHMNGQREVLDFMMGFHKIGLGEGDAILACMKMQLKGVGACCVLDEKDARAAARLIGIRHVGLAGLLGELASAGLVTAQDMAGIVAALRGTNFRISDDLLDGLAGGI